LYISEIWKTHVSVYLDVLKLHFLYMVIKYKHNKMFTQQIITAGKCAVLSE